VEMSPKSPLDRGMKKGDHRIITIKEESEDKLSTEKHITDHAYEVLRRQSPPRVQPFSH
jgi:hypothetical protein